MKRASLHSLFFVLILAAVATAVLGMTSQAGRVPAPTPTAPVAISAGEGPLAMTASLTQSKVALFSEGRTTLSLTLKASRVLSEERVPLPERGVDMVVVLDQSGSMRGEKLRGAKAALRTLVDAMTPQDRFALVSYSNDVAIQHALTACTQDARHQLLQRINALQAGGNTNLGAGLGLGVEMLEQASVGENSRMVLLVSDGLANQGITDADALGGMARQGLSQDIMISTVGVGLDFNEYLMTRLADQGGGSYRFLEDPSTFAAGLFEEFNTVRQTVAENMAVRVTLPKGVRMLGASGYPVLMEGRTAVIRPGSLAAGTSRTLHLSLAVPSTTVNTYAIGPVMVTYGHTEGPQDLTLNQPIVVACVASEREATASIDKEAWERKIIMEDYNSLKEEVANKLRTGDGAGAQDAIEAYAQEKAAANSMVGSARVQQNVEQDLDALRSQLDEVMQAPEPAQAAAQKKFSKSLQHESYRERRGK